MITLASLNVNYPQIIRKLSGCEDVFSTNCRFLCQKLKKGGGKVSLSQEKVLSLQSR